MKYRPGFINPPFEYKQFRVKESVPTRESSVFLGKNYLTEFTGAEVESAIRATKGWVDVDFPIIIRTTGGARPILAEVVTDITAPQWAVGNWVQLEDQEIVHAYKEGSDWVWHVHLITNGTDVNDRYLRFEVKWIWANANDQFSEVITSTSEDMLIPANTPDRTHLVRNIKTHEMPTAKIGAHVLSRLERVASVGTAPTGNPFCSLLQIHVECDTLGSSQITSK